MSLLLTLDAALRALVKDQSKQSVYDDITVTIKPGQIYIALSSSKLGNAYVSAPGSTVDEAMAQLKIRIKKKLEDLQAQHKKLKVEASVIADAVSDLKDIDPPPLTSLAMEAE